VAPLLVISQRREHRCHETQTAVDDDASAMAGAAR